MTPTRSHLESRAGRSRVAPSNCRSPVPRGPHLGARHDSSGRGREAWTYVQLLQGQAAPDTERHSMCVQLIKSRKTVIISKYGRYKDALAVQVYYSALLHLVTDLVKLLLSITPLSDRLG